MADHEDSPHGYWHLNVAIEAVPGLDYDELMDRMLEPLVEEAGGDEATGRPDWFEWHAGGKYSECLFDEGVRHNVSDSVSDDPLDGQITL